MKKLLLITAILLNTLEVFSESSTYCISGKISIMNSKSVYVYLVDEETSKIPFKGIAEHKITPSDQDVLNGYIFYLFNGVKKGLYGIRVFQDTNSNGKLDRGLFGPSEPWGLSWTLKDSKWPSFDNFCFEVTEDMHNIDIKLSQ